MKKLLILFVAFTIFYTHWSIYKKGLQDGEQNYKESHRIYMALKSAYLYGYQDCQANRPNDWDGPEL